jgi:uncharacterized SAM-binding protein YcdF (DUF218 family)
MAAKKSHRKVLLARGLSGFCMGVMLWLVFMLLASGIFSMLDYDFYIPLAGIAGALIGVSRWRKALWVLSGLEVFGILLLGFTPLPRMLIGGWVRSDSLEKVPAVVVLAAGGNEDGSITLTGQERVLRAYEILQQEYAPELVLSHGFAKYPSWAPAVRKQMDNLGLHNPITETGSVEDTHDEALAVAKIARERGWKKIILVTHPMHMRRAAAVFEKTGLKVIAAPCEEQRYDLKHLNGFWTRLGAFKDWMHEVLGYRMYQRHGWI